MKNLNKHQIRKLILKELKSIGEDVLVRLPTSSSTPPLKSSSTKTCSSCMMKMDMCDCEDTYKKGCLKCGDIMNECACQEKSETVTNDYPFSKKEMSDNSSMKMDDLDYHHILKTIMGMHDMSHEQSGEPTHKKHSGAYMSKSQLYKTQRYAKKLYDMIPEGYDLKDWMRTKISQIADDISEVYHALDHDEFKGDV